MALNRKLIASGLATLAVLVSTVAAMAAPAVATSNVNVRSGPGTGYAVVDAMRRGERVDIQYCRGSWCFVERRGPDGWVSSNYLSTGGYRDDYRPAPPPSWGHRPPPRPDWTPPRPPRPDWGHRPSRPDWGPRPPRPYPTNPGASVCFNGPNGYFCAGS
jgi:hypothetical protein